MLTADHNRQPDVRAARVQSGQPTTDRRGVVLVLSAGLFTLIFAFAAFAIDVGYIALTKAQMQSAADAAALAAVIELKAGMQGEMTQDEAGVAARQAAVDVAAEFRNGDKASTVIDGNNDVRLGRRYFDDSLDAYVIDWDSQPYNVVEVTVARRDADGTGLPLFFAPVIGHKTADLNVDEKCTAALLPGVGFQIPPDSDATADALPIALDEPTWEALMNGVGDDDWSYDESTGEITAGSDGVLEVNIYPNGSANLPPGNRGTVDLGNPNNSTNDLKRQILHGLNAYDLSFFGGSLNFENGPLAINGDTGISAGIKSQLEAIKGQPRAIPIFTEVSGPGNNATYTVVKFVGIRIVDVKLTGKPKHKRVIVQPCAFTDSTLIRGSGEVTPDSMIAPVVIFK